MIEPFALALAGGLAVLGWLLGRPLFAALRRAKLRARGLTPADRELLARTWPGYSRVPAALRPRLDGLIAVFIGEKEFVGCRDLEATQAMRLVVAAQACLPVLGHDGIPYRALRSVLIYPAQFVVPDSWQDEDGVVTEEELVLSGESWDVSRIVLSWADVEESGRGGEACNVVIHEFAHYLDHEAGGADGTPWLDHADARQRWADVLGAEFARLREAVARGEETFLDEYAAHDEAEFFAVASEAFFEQPREFARRFPALYGELSGYYRLDPAAWHVSPGV